MNISCIVFIGFVEPWAEVCSRVHVKSNPVVACANCYSLLTFTSASAVFKAFMLMHEVKICNTNGKCAVLVSSLSNIFLASDKIKW